MSLLHHDARSDTSDTLAQLSCFRDEFGSFLSTRSDALFEPADVVLRGDGPVRSPAELSPVGEHRLGHGGQHAAVVSGRVEADRLLRGTGRSATATGCRRPAGPGSRRHLPAAARRPHLTEPNGSCAAPTDRERTSTSPPPGRPYSIVCTLRGGPQFVDRTPERTPPGPRGRHRQLPAAATCLDDWSPPGSDRRGFPTSLSSRTPDTTRSEPARRSS